MNHTESEGTITCQACGMAWPPDNAYWFFDGGTAQQPCKDCVRNATELQQKTALTSAGVSVRELIKKTAKGEFAEIVDTAEVEHLYDDIVAKLRDAGESLSGMIVGDLVTCTKPSVRTQLYQQIIGLAKEAGRIRAERGKKSDGGATMEDLERILSAAFKASTEEAEQHVEPTAE